MRSIFLTLSIILLLCPPSYSQDISGLSLEECLMLSLNNHPSLRKSKASTQDMAAQLESLRAATRLKVSVTGSVRYNGDLEYWDDRYHNEALSITASQLLYDNSRNKIQRQIRTESLIGSQETHKSTMITVAANANANIMTSFSNSLTAIYSRRKSATSKNTSRALRVSTKSATALISTLRKLRPICRQQESHS